jgi:glycosyltransferase involved in cell wall biosynthesis
MKTINILACTIFKYPHVGGSSSHLSSLRESLISINKGVNLDIISWNSGNFISSILKRYQLSFHHKILKQSLPNVTYKGIEYLSHKINLALRRNKYQLLNPQSIFAMNSILLIKEAINIPKILTVHGYATYEAESSGLIKTQEERKYYMDLEYNAYKNADYILAVDSNIKRYISCIDKKFEDKIIVWPNSVSKIFFIDEETKYKYRKKLREKLGIDPDGFVILCPRRLVPKNGVIVPIKSFLLLKYHKNIFLIYSGDGILRKEIKKLIPADLRRKVIFLGNINHHDMVKVYSMADVVVIPSIPHKGVEEATSISALEASAMEIPVIASNIGGLKEIFKNLINAILVEPNNENELALAIEELINNNDLRLSLRKNAKELVKNDYSSTSWVRKYINLINKIIN